MSIRAIKWTNIGDNVFAIVLPQANKKPFATDEWCAIRQIVIHRDGGICSYCGVECVRAHVDHIIPRSAGGPDVLENLTTACPDCNHSKGSKGLDEWLKGRAAK